MTSAVVETARGVTIDLVCLETLRLRCNSVIWLSLFACLAVIGVAGVKLSRHGDVIAEKTGMSRGWVGSFCSLRSPPCRNW
jgi:hypothetical protein